MAAKKYKCVLEVKNILLTSKMRYLLVTTAEKHTEKREGYVETERVLQMAKLGSYNLESSNPIHREQMDTTTET